MTMQINEAIAQISEIHDHLARTEVYRGYRSVPVALSGVVAAAGAIAQPYVLRAEGQRAFCVQYTSYWVGLAVLSGALALSGIVARYVRDSSRARRQARKVLGQFIPCLVGGAAATWAMYDSGLDVVALLPGLWCVLFALGILASRPYLPRATGWVGLFYLCAGGVLLWLAHRDGASLSPWAMGLPFSFGQLAAAAVLYWNLERSDDLAAQ